MLNLAEKYAKLKKTKILFHLVKGEQIVFILASGPKLTMTEAELKTAIASAQSANAEEPASPSDESADKPRKTKKEK